MRKLVAAAIAATAVLLVGAAVVMATGSSQPLELCVPAKEGGAIKTTKEGACKSGFTLTEVNKEGPEGKAGPEGKSGPEGPSSPSVVARARSTAAIVPTGYPPVEIPMTANVFTQQAGEDLIAYGGEAVITRPAGENCSTWATVYVAGHAVAKVEEETNGGPAETRTAQVEAEPGRNSFVFEPGTTRTDTLTARVYGTCPHEEFTIDSLAVDVIGAR